MTNHVGRFGRRPVISSVAERSLILSCRFGDCFGGMGLEGEASMKKGQSLAFSILLAWQ